MNDIELRDTTVYIEGNEVDLRPIIIKGEVSRGANGVVYYGYDDLLDRPVAVKFWQKFRNTDSRDKLQQGIQEARKAWMAKSDNVVEVYHAAVAYGHIYLVMEYVAGKPLKSWLKDDAPSLGRRWNLAYALTRALRALDEKRLHHGDLHSKNIIVVPATKELMLLDLNTGKLIPGRHSQETITYKILDFGTSYFAGQVSSIARHYRIVQKTFSELMYPFTLKSVYGHARPEQVETGFYTWVQRFLWLLCPALIVSGFKAVAMPPEFAIDPYMGYDAEEDLSSQPDSAQLLRAVRTIIDQCGVTNEDVGCSADWSTRVT